MTFITGNILTSGFTGTSIYSSTIDLTFEDHANDVSYHYPQSAITINTSQISNFDSSLIYVTGTTITGGTDLVLTRTDGVNITQDLSTFLDNTDNFTTGTTLVNTTLYFDRSNGLSAYTADLSSLSGGGTGDTFVTGATWFSGANQLTIARNDDVDVTVIIDSFSGLTFDGKEVGDSQFKNWSQWYSNSNTSQITGVTTSTPIIVDNASAENFDMGIVWSPNSKGFNYSAGTLIFTADTLQEFHITVSMTVYSVSNNQLLDFYVRKNGVDQSNLEIQGQFGTSSNRGTLSLTGIIELDTNDYVDLWFQNDTANKNVIINYINFSIVQI
jgi:hypothetical protein